MPPKRKKKDEPPPLPPLDAAKLAIDHLLDACGGYDEWTNGERERATYADDVKRQLGVQLLSDWRVCRDNVAVAFATVQAQVEDLEETIEMMRDDRQDGREEMRFDVRILLRQAEGWVTADTANGETFDRDATIELLRRVADSLETL